MRKTVAAATAFAAVTFTAAFQPAPAPAARTVTGEYVIAQGVTDTGGHSQSAAVRTADGFIPVAPGVRGIEPGQRVRATVTSKAGDQTVTKVTRLATPKLAFATAAAKKAAPAKDRKHTVTIALVTPKGVSGKAVTASQAKKMVKNAGAFWKAQGAGVTFTVDKVVGHYKSKYTCANPWDMWDEAARKSKFKDRDREHLVLFFPASAQKKGCEYGKGTIGHDVQSGGFSYMAAPSSSGLAHELGHNMGLWHAQAFADKVGESTKVNHVLEYGDPYSVMGFSFDDSGSKSAGNVAARHLHRIGLLRDDQVATVTKNSTVSLTAVDTSRGGTGKGIRTIKVTDPNTDQTYWIEYRPKGGIDHKAPWKTTPGVLVRTDVPKSKVQSALIDTRKGSKSEKDAALTKGRSWTSRGKGVTVKVTSAGAKVAKVKITIKRDKSIPEVKFSAPSVGEFHEDITLTATVDKKITGSVKFHAILANDKKVNIGTAKVSKGKATLKWRPKADLARQAKVVELTATLTPKTKGLKKTSVTRAFELVSRATTTKVTVSGQTATIKVTGGKRTPTGKIEVTAKSTTGTKWDFMLALSDGTATVDLSSRLPNGTWNIAFMFTGDTDSTAQQSWTPSTARLNNFKITKRQPSKLDVTIVSSKNSGNIDLAIKVKSKNGATAGTGTVRAYYEHPDGRNDGWELAAQGVASSGLVVLSIPGGKYYLWRIEYVGDAYLEPTGTLWFDDSAP